MPTMAETKPAKGKKQKASETFTAEEKAAMREAAKERKKKTGEADLLEKIAEMPGDERAMAERLHAIITENAPDLAPKTWYGMPAYAKDGDVVVFFQSAAKFKSRYATLGFSDKANLDKGAMWPSSYALKELTKTAEKEIATLVKRAVA
jgi:uncharacterized protein YdhG (YjbR/CyaY superfamily)